jgi:ElaB/YqjD/DUF883 family membrane-anchored ribosome-binding protein
MAEKIEDKKINEALEFLNDVAKEKGAELQDMISGKYAHLQSALGGIAETVRRTAQEAYSQGKAKAKDLAAEMDGNVRRNPWPVLGGTALGFLILGLFLSRSRR